MRVFVAGATGTLGQPAVRLLLAHGHEVFGLSRSEAGRRVVEAMGARGVVANALDADRLRSAVMAARPDVVLHLLTALPPGGPRRASDLTPTNELRTRGTTNILRAAIDAGARRVVAESFAGVYGAARFAAPVPEEQPLPPAGEGPLRDAVLALRSLEDQLRAARTAGEIDTVALRVAFVYGAGVPSTDELVRQARRGWLFAPRGMSGIASFVHVADAASAIVAAAERAGASPVYNVADDEPVGLTTFLSALAEAIEAGEPHAVPAWVARLMAPVMAELGNAGLLLSNAKAKRELGWSLRYPTVHAGLADLHRTLAAAA